MESEQNKAEAPAWTARKLLRAARVGTLATTADGQPFTALVTPAVGPDGTMLMLLSDLSEHVRHLRADPRCALMVTGAADGPNPQTTPRLTVTGIAALADPAQKPRWLARHPYAALYADFLDFKLWQLVPRAGLLVAGFARAHRLRGADLAPDATAVAALLATEADVIDHINQDHAAAIGLLAPMLGGPGGDWRMVAVDTDGCDLSNGEKVLRQAWPAPVADADGVRAALVPLIRHARSI